MGFFKNLFSSDATPNRPRRRWDASVEVATAGWTNPMTGLGLYGLDPTAALNYQSGKIPTAQIVDSLYTHDWLADRVIEKMPSVAMVRGFRVKGGNNSNEQLLKEFRRLNYTERFPRGAFERAVYDGRAYGGAVLLLGYNKGNPTTPLTEQQAAGGVAFLDVFGQHELRVLRRYEDPNHAEFGMPSLYEVVAHGTAMPHPRVGQRFHASRCLRFGGRTLRVPNTGLEINDTTGAHSRPELGVSVLTPVLDMMGQYGLAWRAVSNMLQDASIGVMKLQGLIEALASEDKELIEDRLRTLQQTKSVHRMMFLDAEAGEEYSREEVSLTDVPKLLEQFMVSVAGASETPASIFFSSSPAGLNANSKGEADLTQFYNTCGCYQNTYLGPKLDVTLTAINLGKPVEIEWPSLWESSDNEKAQTRLTHVNADKIAWDMGYSAKQIGKARATGTYVELLGEEPEDDRAEVASAGQPPPGEDEPPQGGPGKQQASKIATKQRAEQK